MRQKMNKEDFLKHVKTACNIQIKDNEIYFSAKEKVQDSILINEPLTKRFIKIIGFIIGIILAILMIIINNQRIRQIRFNGDYPVNQQIEKDLKKETVKIGELRFFKKKLVDINYQIRNQYIMYEWISVAKKGNIVYVAITNNKPPDVKDEESFIEAVRAKKTGIVKKYMIYQGVGMVSYNMAVKEGDIIINNQQHDGTLVSPRGYVLAEVFETKTIKIPKEKTQTAYTGKIKEYRELNILGFRISFGKKKKYLEYDLYRKREWGIKKIINYNSVFIYEKSDIINVYDYDDAKALALNYLDTNFKKTIKEEKIIECTFLNVKETNDSFILEMLIKKLENIA